jgi:NAD(P)-dependent dehydrogenase (short-subunit alcohol dehydrogenase family)
MKHLIIGGSKGIGAELLKQFVAQNEECVVFSRTGIQNLPGVEHIELDVTTDELPDLEDIKTITYCPGSINLKPISSLKEEDFLTDFSINVLGAIRVIKKYHRQLKANNGSIVLFSTVAVQQGMPFHASVAVSKAGVEGLTRSLAAEFAPTIRVNCIAPTITDTPLAAGLLRNEKIRENTAERHPLKRFLAPQEISGMAAYLHSNLAVGITGQVIGIDAGLSRLRV